MPDVDPTRPALAGWSHGGWAIMDLMTMPLVRPGEAGIADPDPTLLDGVKALVLAYPYCGPGALSQLRPWRRAPDVFAFVGENDRVAHPGLCRRAFRAAERSGTRVTTWFLPGATHAFDENGAELPRFVEAAQAIGLAGFRYDEAALRRGPPSRGRLPDRCSRPLADRAEFLWAQRKRHHWRFDP